MYTFSLMLLFFFKVYFWSWQASHMFIITIIVSEAFIGATVRGIHVDYLRPPVKWLLKRAAIMVSNVPSVTICEREPNLPGASLSRYYTHTCPLPHYF